jgi:hypothetical protein
MIHNDWLAAFPHEDAQVVVSTLCSVWAELAALSSATFHAGRREPDLTELLCEQIRAVFKERTKLTGQWSYERRLARITKNGEGGSKVVDRKRTDIEYFSDRQTPSLELTFEFKKLSHTQARRNVYIGEDGMLRFITGNYSAKQPVAIMVGILSAARSACVPPLIQFLQTEKAREALRMCTLPEECVFQPSTAFALNAEFDTFHTRPASLAPPSGAITLCHIFLEFPDGSV